MLGGILLNPQKLEPYSDIVEFVPHVPRSVVLKWLKEFDVFLFPTTCEGSAGAAVEAMAMSLPVLTSANCGSRARDGIEGFIRRYDDIDGYCEALQRLNDDRDLLQTMGTAARQRALAYTLKEYEVDMLHFFENLLNPPM